MPDPGMPHPSPPYRGAPASRPTGLLLWEDGIIQECDEDIEALFGYARCDLISQHVSMLVPELATIPLRQPSHLNETFKYRCHIGQPFLAMTRQGHPLAVSLFLVELRNAGAPPLRLLIRREPAQPTSVPTFMLLGTA